MSKNEKGFCIFFDWIDDLDYLSGDNAWKIIKALSSYYREGTNPIDNVDAELKSTVSLMFHQIQRKETISEKRSDAGKRGGFASAKNSKAIAKPQQNAPTDTDTNTDTETLYNTHSDECVTRTRAKKSKYGAYSHVLLSDDEFKKLHDEYANADEAIAFLDEYIEYKGYKAKNHYLAIKKWVFDALNERKTDKTDTASGSFDTDDFFEAALKRAYGDAMP